jgi:glutamate carboxypeptidase
MDRVFEGEGHRFQRAGETIRGAGIMDMKGGDVVILYALKALNSAGVLDHSTVRVFFTGDEESPGTPTDASRRELVEAARQSDVALSLEPNLGKAAIGKRGLSTWSLDVIGVQGHSAFVLRARGGAGAIYEAARILDGFQRTYSVHPSITVNPGLILGGTDVAYDAERSSGTSAGKFNVIAKAVTVKGDLRFLSDGDREEAKARMREIAAANLPKTTAKLTFEDLVPGWPATDGNRAILRIVDTVSRDLGQGPVEADDPAARGFGDFNFIGSLLSGVDGIGVKGEGFHGPDERIEVKSLGPATTRAAVLISRLLHQQQ